MLRSLLKHSYIFLLPLLWLVMVPGCVSNAPGPSSEGENADEESLVETEDLEEELDDLVIDQEPEEACESLCGCSPCEEESELVIEEEECVAKVAVVTEANFGFVPLAIIKPISIPVFYLFTCIINFAEINIVL